MLNVLRRAEFWRPWLIATALSCVAIAVLHGSGAHADTLLASYYGAESGSRNANGSLFNWRGYSAAHRSWPFGTRFTACYRACWNGVVLDRGPAAKTGRSIDLSYGLASKIGMIGVGVAYVQITVTEWGTGARAAARGPHSLRHRRVIRPIRHHRWG